MVWYSKDPANQLIATKPVALKQPNNWGLYDMNGNVMEWCLDWYDSAYYTYAPPVDPPGPPQSPSGERVLRGGSFWNSAIDCRSASRTAYYPARSLGYAGFRLALSQCTHPISRPDERAQ